MIIFFVISVAYLVINAMYVVFDANYYLYPITASVAFFTLMYRFIVMVRRETQRLTDEISNNYVTNLPKKRFLKELGMAKHVQQSLLQVASPKISGLHIAKKCVPADSIGGDFYSFICKDFNEMNLFHSSPGVVKYAKKTNQYLGIVMGDVAGHGLSSALIMALSSGVFSEIGKRYSSPKKVLTAINSDIIRYIENSHITHVTAFYGVLDLNTWEFVYSRAGHPPTILQRQNNEIIELNTGGAFLGLFKSLDFKEERIQLEKGDRLFFYTDGLTEARDQNGDIFGLDRLISSIQEVHHEPIGTVMHELLGRVDTYTQNQTATDDRSLVILEIQP